MWQKPAQPSASIYRAEAAASSSGRLLLGALYRYLFALLLFLHPLSHLSSFPVELFFSSSSPPPPLITVGVARQQPAHRGQANFLPAVILFRPSHPLSLCSAHRRDNPPPSGAPTFFPLLALLSSHAVIYHRAPRLLPLFFLAPRAAHPPRVPHTAVRHVSSTPSFPQSLVLCYYFPGYRSPKPFPFFPTCPR